MVSTKFGELVKTLGWVAFCGVPDLGDAVWTKINWPTVRFRAIVTAAHVAFVGDAMLDRKHMAGFVRCRLDRAQQAGFEFGLRVPVAKDRPDTDAMAQ